MNQYIDLNNVKQYKKEQVNECRNSNVFVEYLPIEQKVLPEFKDSEEVVDLCILDKERPPPPEPPIWQYFFTVAFPTRQQFNIKHVEIMAQGRAKVVFKPIRYEQCTQSEQYEWIMWILRRNINMICDNYDIFFEQTRDGNIHFHGRLHSYTKQSMKNIRALIHRMFGVDTKNKYFFDIKEYDHAKWNDYESKNIKTYQTLNYPHFKNV